MLNKDELAELLFSVAVADVAREAKVSTKTIYRLRHKVTSPTLKTVERLLEAVKRLRAKRTPRRMATPRAVAIDKARAVDA